MDVEAQASDDDGISQHRSLLHGIAPKTNAFSAFSLGDPTYRSALFASAMYFDNFGLLNNTPKPSAKGPWSKAETAVTRTSPSFPFLQSYKTTKHGLGYYSQRSHSGPRGYQAQNIQTKNLFSKDEASRRLYDDDHDDDACSRHAHTRTHIIYTTFCELYYFFIFSSSYFICEHVIGSEICLNSNFTARLQTWVNRETKIIEHSCE